MAGTTFKAIRENMESLIRGLTPGSRTDIKFRVWDDQRDMVEVAQESPGMVRRFAIAHTFGQTPPEVSDLHTVEVADTFVVQVVYPMHQFSKNMQELEAIIAEDIHLIDDAIGLHGVSNYIDHQHVSLMQEPDVNATDSVALVMLPFVIEYSREVN